MPEIGTRGSETGLPLRTKKSDFPVNERTSLPDPKETVDRTCRHRAVNHFPRRRPFHCDHELTDPDPWQGHPRFLQSQAADQARITRPDLKMLFITGCAENTTLANGFLEPAMEMITKPLAVDALVSRIIILDR